jgi:putative membrane protein
MITLLSTSGWHHHGWFLLWPLIPIFWIAVFVVCARLVFWRGRRGPWAAYAGHAPDPRAILAERYARGEITLEEYRERLVNLQA